MQPKDIFEELTFNTRALNVVHAIGALGRRTAGAALFPALHPPASRILQATYCLKWDGTLLGVSWRLMPQNLGTVCNRHKVDFAKDTAKRLGTLILRAI